MADFGAFVDLGAGVTGLVHISEIGHARVEKVSDAVKVGDWVSFYTCTERVGRTSVTVKVLVVADRTYRRDERVKVTSAEVVSVAVDEDGQPTPIVRS